MAWKEREELDLYVTESMFSRISVLIGDGMFDFVVGVFIVKHLATACTADWDETTARLS